MIKRIIEISNPSYLKLKDKQLIIEQEGEMVGKIPIEDIGALILNHYAITLTQQLIIECQKNKVAMIFCDEKHLPISVLLSITQSNSLHQKIIKEQTQIKRTTQKNIWSQIVVIKILEQSKTLKLFDKPHQRLIRLANEVKVNDSTNCEAQAALYYWRTLFDDSFRRNRCTGEVNALLNYGYSIIRSAVARSICASGLHPSLGVFHKNQYNDLALADDLMEPLRPFVDRKVYQLFLQEKTILDKETKLELIQILKQDVRHKTRKMPLMVSLSFLIADFKKVMNQEIKILKYPALID